MTSREGAIRSAILFLVAWLLAVAAVRLVARFPEEGRNWWDAAVLESPGDPGLDLPGFVTIAARNDHRLPELEGLLRVEAWACGGREEEALLRAKLGAVLLLQHRTAEAAEELRASLSLDDGAPAVRSLLARALVRAERGTWELARALHEEEARLFPDLTVARNWKARFHLRLGEIRAAEEEVREIETDSRSYAGTRIAVHLLSGHPVRLLRALWDSNDPWEAGAAWSFAAAVVAALLWVPALSFLMGGNPRQGTRGSVLQRAAEVAGAVLAGALSVAVVDAPYSLTNIFIPLDEISPPPGDAIYAFAVVGVIEEGAKLTALLAVLLLPPRGRPSRTILCLGLLVGLGFGAVENAPYVEAGGIGAWVGRSLVTVPSHCLDCALAAAGLAWGLHLRRGGRSRRWATVLTGLGAGFILAVLAHGAWDTLCFRENRGLRECLAIGQAVLVAALYVALARSEEGPRAWESLWKASRGFALAGLGAVTCLLALGNEYTLGMAGSLIALALWSPGIAAVSSAVLEGALARAKGARGRNVLRHLLIAGSCYAVLALVIVPEQTRELAPRALDMPLLAVPGALLLLLIFLRSPGAGSIAATGARRGGARGIATVYLLLPLACWTIRLLPEVEDLVGGSLLLGIVVGFLVLGWMIGFPGWMTRSFRWMTGLFREDRRERLAVWALWLLPLNILLGMGAPVLTLPSQAVAFGLALLFLPWAPVAWAAIRGGSTALVAELDAVARARRRRSDVMRVWSAALLLRAGRPREAWARVQMIPPGRYPLWAGGGWVRRRLVREGYSRLDR